MTTLAATDTSVAQLQEKIQKREARIGIIGLGYVGLPLALLYSAEKFKVTGFDIDQRKVDTIAKGGSYIFRITTGRNSGGQGARLHRHSGLQATYGHGRHHHLRSDAAE